MTEFIPFPTPPGDTGGSKELDPTIFDVGERIKVIVTAQTTSGLSGSTSDIATINDDDGLELPTFTFTTDGTLGGSITIVPDGAVPPGTVFEIFLQDE
jgi:hypothetical protein